MDVNLDKYGLSQWEKDILEEFMQHKNILDLLDYVDKDCWDDFLINLADGLFEWKSGVEQKG